MKFELEKLKPVAHLLASSNCGHIYPFEGTRDKKDTSIISKSYFHQHLSMSGADECGSKEVQ